VRKLFPGAYAPSFEYEDLPTGSFALGYYSHRNLCSFAEGLIEGSADYFGESVEIEQSVCSKHGGDRCVLVTKFTKKT
jgi:hypothetical protein